MENNEILTNGVDAYIKEQNEIIQDLEFKLSVQNIINVALGIVIVVMSICLYHYIENTKLLEGKIENLETSYTSLYNNLVKP